MCGYCIEGMQTLPLVEQQRFGQQTDDFDDIFDQYSLERDDYFDVLQDSDSSQSAVDITICRLFEKFVNNGFSQHLFESVAAKCGKNAIASCIQSAVMQASDNYWASLAKLETYENEFLWRKIFQDEDRLNEKCNVVLNRYINWWHKGRGKRGSDPDFRFEETGIMDPIDNTTPVDWEKFYKIFPLVYFCFCVVAQLTPGSIVLQRLALSWPADVPDFKGYDLWLQRKAFSAVTQHNGLQFILKNIGRVRTAAAYYALLRGTFAVDELQSLQDSFLRVADVDGVGMRNDVSPADIEELLNRLILHHRI